MEDNFDKSTKFRCYECKEVVSRHNKFNEDMKENQMCKLCTMTAEYGEKSYVLGPAKITALHLLLWMLNVGYPSTALCHLHPEYSIAYPQRLR